MSHLKYLNEEQIFREGSSCCNVVAEAKNGLQLNYPANTLLFFIFVSIRAK